MIVLHVLLYTQTLCVEPPVTAKRWCEIYSHESWFQTRETYFIAETKLLFWHFSSSAAIIRRLFSFTVTFFIDTPREDSYILIVYCSSNYVASFAALFSRLIETLKWARFTLIMTSRARISYFCLLQVSSLFLYSSSSSYLTNLQTNK